MLADGKHARLDRLPVEAGDPERIGDVVEGRLVRHQRGRAEDRRRFAHPRFLLQHVLAVDQDGTALRLLDTGDDLERSQPARLLIAQERRDAARGRLHAEFVENDAPVLPALDLV